MSGPAARPPHDAAAQAADMLREMGVRGGGVSAAGHEGEIAALSIPDAEFERMLGVEGPRLAARLRSLGFRYVALDLAGDRVAGGREP